MTDNNKTLSSLVKAGIVCPSSTQKYTTKQLLLRFGGNEDLRFRYHGKVGGWVNMCRGRNAYE